MSASDSQTRSESRVTTDDRALLLPCFRRDAADTGNQRKPTIVDANSDVYTITDESLPSHMRSLLPSHEQHVHDLLTLERTRRRLRYVIISLSVLLALTVLVAVALVFSLKVKSTTSGLAEANAYSQASRLSTDTEVTEVATEVKISLLSRERRPAWAVYRHSGPEERRTQCVTECWAYAAFRFRSVCQNGFCRCHGENYDTNTCLPNYKDCQIQRRPPAKATARLFGKNQTTYSCQTSSRDPKSVHVISIFGNHRSSTTQVTVSSQSSSEKILVLVNYHFVKWTVHLPKNSGISEVFVVSTKWISQADQVNFTGASSEEPPVIHKLSLTGYGQDKNGGHTPKLLQFIQKEIGPVTSFLGASHADEFTVDLDDVRKSTTSQIPYTSETTSQ